MRTAILQDRTSRQKFPTILVAIAAFLILAGSKALGQDPATAPPSVLSDFVLSEVEFRGRVNVGLAEIEEKTGLKKGARSDIFRNVASLDEIRKLYRHKGYEQAEVNLIEGSKPGETRVIIEIIEGPKSETKPMAVTTATSVPMQAISDQKPGIASLFGQDSLPNFAKSSSKKELAASQVSIQPKLVSESVIREIRIEGIQTIPEADLRAKLNSKVGDNLDFPTVESDLKYLLRMKSFSRIHIYYDESHNDPGFILIVKVTEMPVLQDVQIRGLGENSGINLKEIEDVTGLKEGARGDSIKVQMAKHQIQTLYAEKGYNDAEVNVVEGDKAGDKRVIIEINQGPRSEPKPKTDSRTPVAGSPAIAGLFDFSSPIKDFPEFRVVNYAAEVHLEKAKHLRKSGNLHEAIEEATQAISLSPDLTEAYRIRSKAFCSKRLYRRAIDDWSRLIGSADVTSNDFISRGWTYAEDRDLDHALADMETALKLSKTDQERRYALRYRGWVHLLRGDLEQALADYSRVVELDPGEQIHHLELGGCLAKMGRHALAIGEFDQAIAIRPDATTSYKRAESRFASGEYALALADYEQAVKSDPNNEWYRQGRGWGLLSRGHVDQAIEEFTFAIEGDPEKRKKTWTFGSPPPGFQSQNHRAFTGRGWAYLVKHDLERAKADFEKAEFMQSPGIIPFDFALAANLSLQPIYDRAVAEFNERCSRVPKLRWALVILKEQDARSQFLENPYFAAYLVCRSRPDSALAPNLIFRVVADWRSSSEARSAFLGSAIVAARQFQWQEALDNLDSALEALVESRYPGSTRPPFSEFLRGQ